MGRGRCACAAQQLSRAPPANPPPLQAAPCGGHTHDECGGPGVRGWHGQCLLWRALVPADAPACGSCSMARLPPAHACADVLPAAPPPRRDAIKGLADMAGLQRVTVPCRTCTHRCVLGWGGAWAAWQGGQQAELRRCFMDDVPVASWPARQLLCTQRLPCSPALPQAHGSARRAGAAAAGARGAGPCRAACTAGPLAAATCRCITTATSLCGPARRHAVRSPSRPLGRCSTLPYHPPACAWPLTRPTLAPLIAPLQVRVLQRDLLELEELCEVAGLPVAPA